MGCLAPSRWRSLTPDGVRLWERRQGIHCQIARTRGRRSRLGLLSRYGIPGKRQALPPPPIKVLAAPMKCGCVYGLFPRGHSRKLPEKTAFCPDCATIAHHSKPCNRIAKHGLFPAPYCPVFERVGVSVFLCADDFGTQTRAPLAQVCGAFVDDAPERLAPIPNAWRRCRKCRDCRVDVEISKRALDR